MKKFAILAAVFAAFGATTTPAAFAEPVEACHRGPIPQVFIINSPTREFIVEIQRVYRVSESEALAIAYVVCRDRRAVGSDERIQQRLIEELQARGYLSS